MQPKVSILMPVYNVEKYLRQCMDSVIGQTLREVEIICVNDGATDGSPEILKEYAEKDSRVIVINKENGGYGKAMNVAADRATGEYIGIVEPDDFVPENMFEQLYKTASENSLDLVKADFYRFAQDEATGEYNYSLVRLSEDNGKYNVLLNPSKDPECLSFTKNTWTGIYRREFLQTNNIRHNETPGASYQDNGFWFQTFIFAERAMIVNTPFYRYRTDNPNSSVKNLSKIYAIDTEYDFIRKILESHPEKLEIFKNGFWYGKYKSCINTIARISKEYKKDYIKHVSADFKSAYEKGEINNSIFNKLEWFNVELIIKAPMSYYYLHAAMGTKAMKTFKSLTYGNAELKAKIKSVKKKVNKV